jgi:hypothetical protein
MPRWHQPYLGLTEFPADRTTFELDFFFTFQPTELDALKSRYKPLLRIGEAIQLGFLKMAGCPATSLKMVPRRLLHHLGQQLGETAPLIASLRSLYKKRRRTLYEHQAWAIELLGLAEMGERQERMLFAQLRDMARSSSSRDLLVQFAREWLYEHKLLIPPERRLRDLARRAMTDVEQDLFDAVAQAIPQEVRDRWLQELSTQFARNGQPLAQWLDQGPKRGIRKGRAWASRSGSSKSFDDLAYRSIRLRLSPSRSSASTHVGCAAVAHRALPNCASRGARWRSCVSCAWH